jgi:hypothetical protein
LIQQQSIQGSTLHITAFLGTGFTGFCAFLAMLRMMSTAFFRALITNISADAADFGCPVTAKAHQLRCCITDSSTFHIELNAVSHHFNVWLLRTGRSTMITNGCTPKTCFNTLLVFMISFHNNRFGCYAKGML